MGEKTIKEYMAQICDDTGPGIVRPTFRDAVCFELKGHFLMELHENTFSRIETKDANDCELCHGSHLSIDFPNKEQVKEADEVYYREFHQRPFQNEGRYKANAPMYHVKEENKMGYQEKRSSLEETLNKFMEESAKGTKKIPSY
nr:hypothetical protein [Tanacetum cinerariifolium]